MIYFKPLKHFLPPSLSRNFFTLIIAIMMKKAWWLHNKITFDGYTLSNHSIIHEISQRINEF